MDGKKIKRGLKEAGDIAGALTVVVSGLAVLKPVVDAAVEKGKEILEERKALVDIPELYSKGFPIKLDRAIEELEESNLKAEPIAVSVNDANQKYKDCFDLQIVGSKPKAKQKVKPGTLVFLKYVTSEVIEKSQKLFDESEKRKAEEKRERVNKRAEQKEKYKKTVDKMKHDVERVLINRNK
jgi:hypothetical protein